MTARPGIDGRFAWLQALHAPEQVLAWSLADWERVVRLARRMRLLARLACRLDEAGLLARLPPQVQQHLCGEQHLSRARTGAVLWAIERIGSTLADTPWPRVLLKGAAYLGQDLAISRGRLPSDLDILVAREHLAACQARLQAVGWQPPEMDAHDQAHYTEYGHEVPPMAHPLHDMELDLHHNILPPRDGVLLPVDRLLARAQPARFPGWLVFQPVDQVLHSAAHLFHDSALRDRVRDLVDLDGLLRHFGTAPDFWPALVARARELGLDEPLALALALCARWLGTPVPAPTAAALRPAWPGRPWRAVLLWLFAQALLPDEPDAMPTPAQRLAAQVLFVRFHLRRLPLRRLLPHAWHKLHKLWRPAVAPVADAGLAQPVNPALPEAPPAPPR